MDPDRLPVPLGHCSCCGQAVPGWTSHHQHTTVTVGFHAHPKWWLWLCIGSNRSMTPVKQAA